MKLKILLLHLLKLILKNIKDNKDEYDLENNLIVLVNKCDDMYFSDNILRLDTELEKMFEQAHTTIQSKINEAALSLKWNILPISCENSLY